MKVISFSEARNSLKAVLDRVIEDADYTIVTRRDADDVVVMSLESFNEISSKLRSFSSIDRSI
jgi:antitoxin YefM